MPGIIDVHAHFKFIPGVIQAISPAMYANLLTEQQRLETHKQFQRYFCIQIL